MRALLDVNVLIALLDASHIHHHRTTAWLRSELNQGWASCPITQNGCIRIMSQPNYPGGPFSCTEVAARLTEAASSSHHLFWTDSINLLQPHSLDWSKILGHRQITDTYLLALAIDNGGRFVTFDRRIDPAIAHARAEQLVILQ